MLNKRVKLVISVLITSILMFGCSNKNEIVEEKQNEVMQETIEEVTEENVEEFVDEYAYETIEERYERLKPMLEEVLQKYNIEYELDNNGISSYVDLGNRRKFRLEYHMVTDTYIPFISVFGYIDEDVENIKVNGFKMEESFLGDISRVVIKDGIDYSNVNEKVTDGIVNGEWCMINNEYGNIKEYIAIENQSFEPNRLTYTYTIAFNN